MTSVFIREHCHFLSLLSISFRFYLLLPFFIITFILILWYLFYIQYSLCYYYTGDFYLRNKILEGVVFAMADVSRNGIVILCKASGNNTMFIPFYYYC